MKIKLFNLFFVCLIISFPIQKLEAATNKLSGRILLQVQQKGEAWYVNPADQKRYFLGRPADAFALMRQAGLGISEENYNKFKNNNYKVSSGLAGKILLRVESKGEAYYINPLDLKMHYLGRPADAFAVMRKLGLGITDADLGKVAIGKGVEKNVKEEIKIIPEIKDEEQKVTTRETHEYVGSGTYDFGEGDVLIDNVNNMRFVQSGLYEEYGQQWLIFKIFNIATGEEIENHIMMYLEPERLYTGYEPTRLIYSFYPESAKIPLYYFTFKGKNPDGTYKASFDFYLDDVLGGQSAGNKKILIVPAYFDDEYEVYDQFQLYRDTFLEPALEEIQAYLKVKQLEFMNKEIMTVDFTVADAIKLGKSKDYLPNDKTDNYQSRKKMVQENTNYDPDDFDETAFLFFSEAYTENTARNTARYDQAMITSHQSPITDYELNTPIQIHQIRNWITKGMLHEILHIYGMSDINGSGKTDVYEGLKYDGGQKFFDDININVTENSQIGQIQKIDESIAHEIGWCDENNNGIFDASEYYVNREN